MSGDFSADLARASGPIPADCPAGGPSWEGTLAPIAAPFVSAVLPAAPPGRPPVGCDNASAGQSHIRHIQSTNTVRLAVIFITASPRNEPVLKENRRQLFNLLGRPLMSLTAETSSRIVQIAGGQGPQPQWPGIVSLPVACQPEGAAHALGHLLRRLAVRGPLGMANANGPWEGGPIEGFLKIDQFP